MLMKDLTVNEVDELIKIEVLAGKRFKDVKDVYCIGKSRFSRILKELQKENKDFHNSRENRSLGKNNLAYISVNKTGYRIKKGFDRTVLSFGNYPTKEEAIYMRDKLLNVDWNYKLLSKEDRNLIKKYSTNQTNKKALKYIKWTQKYIRIIYKNNEYGSFDTIKDAIKERNRLLEEKKIR